LLRTYPYWESIVAIKALIVAIGLMTAIIATFIGRVQSTVKTQIAYSSAAQIGLMFIEVAIGLHTLALIHFAGNAFLRTYQLLVSPSVLSYLVHDMFFNLKATSPNNDSPSIQKIKNSIYILSIKEWNLDVNLHHFLWKPFKWVGNKFDFLTGKVPAAVLAVLFAAGLYSYFFQDSIPAGVYESLPDLFSLIGFILILKTFTERGDALRAWTEIVSSQLFIALSIALLNENFEHNHIMIYLSGSVLSAIVGFVCLSRIKAIDNNIKLNQFHGYVYEQPVTAFIFLLACLGLVGLPFTPTFIGIDLLFSHIHRHEVFLIVLTALSFLFIEIAVLRIYARIFLGQHKKNYHPIAFRSS
jgi:NADH:ubiquinone oxidoreductase subunit 5 (subunit L)/multisubunit Na+/H+ antiporter MnhA subunit